MNIDKQIQYHCDNKKFCVVQRQVADDIIINSNGYIVDRSEHFILMQESIDFAVLGYLVFPIATIAGIRFGNNEKYYDKIMRGEKLINSIIPKHNVDLTDWTSIFRTIKKTGFNVIIENEDPADETFDIGPIAKVTKNAVYITHFDVRGYLDTELTKITFDKISLAKFDEPYINIFSKYLRQR